MHALCKQSVMLPVTWFNYFLSKFHCFIVCLIVIAPGGASQVWERTHARPEKRVKGFLVFLKRRVTLQNISTPFQDLQELIALIAGAGVGAYLGLLVELLKKIMGGRLLGNGRLIGILRYILLYFTHTSLNFNNEHFVFTLFSVLQLHDFVPLFYFGGFQYKWYGYL